MNAKNTKVAQNAKNAKFAKLAKKRRILKKAGDPKNQKTQKKTNT